MGRSRVGVRELRQNLSVNLRRVKDGESLEVTEQGRPVARLIPLAADRHGRLAEMNEDGRATRAGEPMNLALVLMRRAQLAAMFTGDRQAAAADLVEAMGLFRRLETRPMLEQAERMAAMLG